eukprot:NODE_6_length_70510_cov_1.054395.p48 type:complete len:167 gc:universal NODE_6_length_70510_cov_1.054395:64309-63809(-)
MSDQLESQIIAEIINLVQEMQESLPQQLNKKNSESPNNVSRSKEILYYAEKSPANNKTKPTPVARERPIPAERPGVKKSQHNLASQNLNQTNESLTAKENDLRPRIRPLVESKEKYILPDNWESIKFDDPQYQVWRTAIIRSLQDQPDMITTVPKLFKELNQSDFL